MAQTSSSSSTPRLMRRELREALVNGNIAQIQQILRDNAVSSPTDGAAEPRPCHGTVTTNEDTTLHLAARHGHMELVDIICQEDPSLVVKCNVRFETPMHCAARAGCYDVVDRLIRCAGDLVQRQGGVGREAVLRARNWEGATALFEAVRYKQVEVVGALMQVDPQMAAIPNNADFPPLYMAGDMASDILVSALLRPSYDGTQSPASYVAFSSMTALHTASWQFKEASTKAIVQKILQWKPALIREQDERGRTPLHYAALLGNLSVIGLLLRHDASVAYLKDKDGLTPMHIAAIMGHTKIIDELMENCTDYKGRTPLHLSIKHRESTTVRLLLQHRNVDVTILNIGCCTPADDLHRWDDYGRFTYIMNPESQIYHYFKWSKTLAWNPGWQTRTLIVDLYSFQEKNNLALKDNLEKFNSMSKAGAISSVLIVTVTFAVAFTVPGGYVADTGAPTLANRGSQCVVAAFAFGVHLLLPSPADRSIVVAVGLLSVASVMFIDRADWWWVVAVKLTWIRAGWRGLLAMKGIFGRAMIPIIIGGFLIASVTVNIVVPNK